MAKRKNKFIVVDQAAEVKLRLTGETLEDLFLEALEGLAYLLYEQYQAAAIIQITIPIKVSSLDINSLLVDFLSEVLYQSEIHQAVFFKARLKRFTNSKIEADLLGQQTHQFNRNIKAVTYHGVRILRNEDSLWQTEIIFDI